MSNDIRNFLKKMRNAKNGIEYQPKEKINEAGGRNLNMRQMLGKMRSLKEQQPEPLETTDTDQRKEEEKMNQFFNDDNVNIEYEPLEIYDNGIFWGGTIDGQLQWTFSVTPTEEGSGVEVNHLEDFDRDDPDNEKIIKKLESYYDGFYEFWRNNTLS